MVPLAWAYSPRIHGSAVERNDTLFEQTLFKLNNGG